MDYGPTIAAAFAAREDDMINSPSHHRNGVTGGNGGGDTEDGFNTTNDVTALRKIILGCMRNARDYAMIASREREEQMEGVAGMSSSSRMINDDQTRMRGRYDNESAATSSTRIPSSTRNMGFHQAFSAEASERRRMGDTGELPENDDLSEEEESSRNRDKAPVVVPPVVDLLG
jgi:hypothetical protein